jgi:hypothetical protein
MLLILIASLTVLLMASLTANGYLYGLRRATNPAETVKEPAIRPEPAMTFGFPTVPRPPETNTETGREQRFSAGTGRRIVSPTEAITREKQKRDGLVPTQEQPKVPPAIKNGFLKDAGAVVASSAT